MPLFAIRELSPSVSTLTPAKALFPHYSKMRSTELQEGRLRQAPDAFERHAPGVHGAPVYAPLDGNLTRFQSAPLGFFDQLDRFPLVDHLPAGHDHLHQAEITRSGANVVRRR